MAGKRNRKQNRGADKRRENSANTQSKERAEPSADNEPATAYSLNHVQQKLDLHKATVTRAIEDGLLASVPDTDGNHRIASDDIKAVLESTSLYEKIAGNEYMRVRDIADALNIRPKTVRKRLQQAALDRNRPLWSQIRGLWELPQTLTEFRKLVYHNRAERHQTRKTERDLFEQRERQHRNAEKRRRADLRAQLVASFPAWSELDRSEQLMILHVGPPNSGKTHDALNRLVEAGSGWYLAPLRLLAWEIYDRLNQRGIKCDLLTGEEYIPAKGATITAATIEMFNPNDPGEVVIIDEAQMLADPDRGWAWTRAMMSSLAPEVHIIGPETVQGLILKMAEAANMSVGTISHDRLAPIQVASKPWPLDRLPPKTILVAFSRKMVLELKTRLETMRRSVSVVYGSLPPEVRRKQAERFAAGETDICIATDAVGMGLNLPADCVCFYEIEKFDGRDIRLLKPAEVQQIGGRAGRYGYSHAGEVGATRRSDLKIIRELFYAEPEALTHARVAPSVNDLDIIPGTLADKLNIWARLQSIPLELRDAVRTADMNERIELAKMLSDDQVSRLGLPNAVQMVNAPTRKTTRDFWYDCATAIIDEVPMPLPPAPPDEIFDTEDLDYTETCIACADIYLWLSQRKEFREFAEHTEQVRAERQEWSDQIDEALVHKIQSTYNIDRQPNTLD